MEWKEALYILNKDRMFSQQEIEALAKLPMLRDEVFFPDYEKYGYIALSESLSSLGNETGTYTIEMALVSTNVNRKLSLSYTFRKNKSAENGVITDMIFIQDKKAGWDIMIEMDVLMQKRNEHPNNFDYRRLSSYSGSLEEKISACLRQIKHNYDTYALDIISGENWDADAHDTSYY